MKRLFLFRIKNILLLMALCLCGINVQQSWAANPTDEYVIGIDDVLEITIRNHADLNSTVTVRPDGKISVPRAGEITASGQTAPSLAETIQTKLSQWLNRAYVTVTIKEVHSQRARVVGAVNSPGAYDLKPTWHVMDLVAVAGGLTTKPTRISGRIIRDGNVIPFDIEDANENPNGEANVRLRTGDLVILDKQDFTKQIHVVGQVKSPGAFDLDENLTVINLLAQAGDATPQAALRRAYVMRGSEQITLDLQSVLIEGQQNAQVSNFRFQPGDVLVIPANTERFGVMGKVSNSGYFPLPDKDSQATVVKALAAAGGPSPDGDLRHATITRTKDGKTEVQTLDIEAMLKGSAPDNVVLQANDILHIPKLEDQVHVIGEISRPGAYKLSDDLNLVSLIAEAGSPQTDAKLSAAYILRNNHQLPINLRPVLIEGKSDPAVTGFRLEHGDVLVIPRNQKRIGIMGEVKQPGYLSYPENQEDATLLKVLAKAGGATADAKLKDAGILRMVDGNPTRIPVNLSDILQKGTSEDKIVLLPEDILYIPQKGKGSSWTQYLNPLLLLGNAIF